MWIGISCALSVCAAICCLIVALRAARTAEAALASLAASQPWPESRWQSLTESINELSETQSLLANKLKMMKVRGAATHTDGAGSHGLPDPYRDPDAWRKAMNERIAQQRIGLR